jgi:crotonobetainyl-CoA:carnitine CoA-transferase CaiB-like acyl-CoA transferase
MSDDGLLSNISILDVTEEYNAYAAKLFAGLGADVIKVEPPDGEPGRNVPPHAGDPTNPGSSAFFGYLNTGKRGISLDPSISADRRLLDDILDRADIVIEDHLDRYGRAPEAVAESPSGTVVVSLSTFGRTHDREGATLLDAATGGLMYQTGYAERPPTVPGLSLATYQGVVQGAVGALLGVRVGDEGGQHVDVSRREPVISNLESTYTDYTYNGRITARNGNTHPVGHPMGEIYPTADGAICICLLGQQTEGPLGGKDLSMWEKFCRMLDRDDLLEDERFNATPDDTIAGFLKRKQNATELDELLREELSDWSAEELYHDSQAHGISNALVSTPADLFESDQLAHRDFFTETTLPNGEPITFPTAPYEFSASRVMGDRAPRLDEHGDEIRRDLPDRATPTGKTAVSDDVEKPLNGVRVLDFSIAWAGPYCTRILANHGADVIKVESTTQPDATRTITPLFEDEPGDPIHGEDRSGAFQEKNLGKRCLSVNLRTDEGTELIKEIVEDGDIDVIVESFAPGTFERMGLGYETLRDLNDDLVMCSISGYGQTGPESDYRAYGAMLGAHAGIPNVTGFPDDEPVRAGVAYVDPATGLHAAFGILSALHDRDKGGSGQYIDFAMREVGVTLIHQALSHYDLTGEDWERVGNRDERERFVQGCYRCADDDHGESWVAIVVRNEPEWRALGRVMGSPEWTDDRAFSDQRSRLRNQADLDERIESWTRTRDRYEVAAALRDAGVPATVVKHTGDLLENDDHLREREFWQDVTHPVIGTQLYPAPMPRLSKTPGEIRGPGPMIGQHTRETLYDVLDLSGERVAKLEESGVLD